MKKFLLPAFVLVSSGIMVFLAVSKKEDIFDLRYNNKRVKSSIKNEGSDFKKLDEKVDLPQTQDVSFALEIKGDEEFKNRIKESLRLLWLYDKEGSFKMIRRYIFEIVQSNRTNYFTDGEHSVMEISSNFLNNSSKTYLASVMAHLGWHAYYIYSTKDKRKPVDALGNESIDKSFTPPFIPRTKSFSDLCKVEEQAFNYQMEVLKKINAPRSELRFLEKRKYNDFSPAHDGNYFIQF